MDTSHFSQLRPVEGLQRVGRLRNVLLFQRWSQRRPRRRRDASNRWASRRRRGAAWRRGRGRRRGHPTTGRRRRRRARASKSQHGCGRERAAGGAGDKGGTSGNNSCRLPLQGEFTDKQGGLEWGPSFSSFIHDYLTRTHTILYILKTADSYRNQTLKCYSFHFMQLYGEKTYGAEFMQSCREFCHLLLDVFVFVCFLFQLLFHLVECLHHILFLLRLGITFTLLLLKLLLKFMVLCVGKTKPNLHHICLL